VYYARSGTPLDTSGIYAIPPGGAPVKISDRSDAGPIWVDGDQLVIAWLGSLSTMPRAGGSRQLVAEVPLPHDQEPPLAKAAYALDAKAMYVGMNGLDKTFTLWAVPRAGGTPTALFTSTDPAYSYAWDHALQIDGDALYVVADGGTGFGPLVRIPKSGGTPVTVRPEVAIGYTDNSVLSGDALYSEGITGALTRYPLAPDQPSTTIAGPDGTSALVTAMVADDRGTYANLAVGPQANRLALAPVPGGTDHVALLACTPASDEAKRSLVTQMALTSTHVYALASILPNDGGGLLGYSIVRAARAPARSLP
jgi:hypothetical protein